MSFCLSNEPSTFMSLMNEFLSDFIRNFLIVYLDDILIFSNTKEEHLQHLELVLRRLHKEKLIINLDKCLFI